MKKILILNQAIYRIEESDLYWINHIENRSNKCKLVRAEVFYENNTVDFIAGWKEMIICLHHANASEAYLREKEGHKGKPYYDCILSSYLVLHFNGYKCILLFYIIKTMYVVIAKQSKLRFKTIHICFFCVPTPLIIFPRLTRVSASAVVSNPLLVWS